MYHNFEIKGNLFLKKTLDKLMYSSVKSSASKQAQFYSDNNTVKLLAIV